MLSLVGHQIKPNAARAILINKRNPQKSEYLGMLSAVGQQI